MGYSTEWVVLIFILAVTGGVVYQCLAAGHLPLLVVAIVMGGCTLWISHHMGRK